MTSTIGAILPKGKTQFCDGTGTPLAGGEVAFYIPATTTPLATYEDQALTIANPNPVILDGNGEALIWGFGSYRQIVTDSSGNQIWDDIVGAPNVPVFGVDTGAANALAVAISGVASLFTGLQIIVIPAHSNTAPVTLSLNGGSPVNVTTGTNAVPTGAILAGVAAQLIFDGTNLQLLNSQIPPGAAIPGEVRALAGPTPPTGWDLCYGKTYSRAINTALFAAIGTAWGAGDGATTFLGPDLRGRGLFGADAMGGTAAGRLTDASLGGTTSATVGAVGGNELYQYHSHGATVTDPTHVHPAFLPDGAAGSYGGGASSAPTVQNTGAAATGISVAISFTGGGGSENLPPAAVINWMMFIG